MRLILITHEQTVPGETIACRELFDAGLQLLHLRKPAMQTCEMAAWINAIPAEYHDRIVLHDHFALAGEHIKRIHLNSRNPHPSEDKELIISCSCHSLEEVKEKANKRNKNNLFPVEAGTAAEQAREQSSFFNEYEYLFLSPIFNSISKQGYRAAFADEQLVNARNRGVIIPKVIALGGISKENLRQVAAWGFGGVALIGNIWGDYGVTGDIKSLIKRYKELQTICDTL